MEIEGIVDIQSEKLFKCLKEAISTETEFDEFCKNKRWIELFVYNHSLDEAVEVIEFLKSLIEDIKEKDISFAMEEQNKYYYGEEFKSKIEKL